MIGLIASALSLGVLWHSVRPGIWLQESQMASHGPIAVVRAVAIRIDPSVHRLRLDLARRDYGLRPAWTIDSIPEDAVVAFNAGQFLGGFPWGWVVRDGVESTPPGSGSLAMALVVDSGHVVALATPAEIPSQRSRALIAFQSYPALLVDGEIPWELRAPGRGVDLAHRDSRLAICTLADASLVVVITRFTGLGKPGSTLPWGPTVPEMAEYMRSFGCRRAMLLDGGISSQLAMRTKQGALTRWTNWRTVPMGIVIFPREIATNTRRLH
jgi:hypothetical protein